jgi:starch phosphorylase
VITLYNRIKAGKEKNHYPRTVIFGGKAAPGYAQAKEIIYLINSIANLVNQDKTLQDQLKVVFLPNYGVSLAEKIFPGSDLSEQISTAGMEASGTGNMKFALNGALTIGTLDGANIEIMEEVGEENIFIFGKTEGELRQLRESGYNPRVYYEDDAELFQVMNQIKDGYFSPSDPDAFKGVFDSLVNNGDHYFHFADYRAYLDCQGRVTEAFQNSDTWHRTAILNVARMGKFSSDRVIQQYAEDIWDVKACPIENL